MNCKCGCGKRLPRFNTLGKLSRFVHGHNNKGKHFNALHKSRISLSHRKLSKPIGSISICKNGRIIKKTSTRKWKLLSRLTMEKYLGRKLLTKETVHHKDDNYQNNKKSNLELLYDAKHKSMHSLRRWNDSEYRKFMSIKCKKQWAKKRRSKSKIQIGRKSHVTRGQI